MKSSRIFPSIARTFIVELAWLVLITALPLVPLLVPDSCYGMDWTSHLWLTAYHSEYFKQHLSFPEVIHTTQLAGMPFPVFYGVLLYPYLGVVGAAIGAAGAMRVAVVAVFFLQSWQVFRLAMQAGRDRTFALIVAAVTTWSIYGLTNLYSRGAFAELIGVALLTAAIGALGRVLLLPPGERRGSDMLSGLLFFVLAAGAHPITALCGGLFIAVVAMVFFFQAERRAQVVRWGLVGGAAIAVVLSPWVLVVIKFSRDLLVSRIDSHAFSYLEVDTVWSRLAPFPYDARLAENSALPFDQSPHLDVQLSTGLLLLALFLSAITGLLLARKVRLDRPGLWIMGVFGVLFIFLFVLSVTPGLGLALPPLRNVQYAYRLVSYLNLALLLVVLGGLVALSSTQWAGLFKKSRVAVLLLVFAVTFIGLLIKWRHATERAFVISDMAGPNVAQMPRGFVSWYGYAILTRPVALDSPGTIVTFPVNTGAKFGEAQAFQVDHATAGPVEIRAQPFPWNEVRVDGRAVMTAPETWQRRGGIIVPLAAGRHDVEYTWNPDPLWRWLNRVSRVTLLLWGALVLGSVVRQARGRGAKTAATAP